MQQHHQQQEAAAREIDEAAATAVEAIDIILVFNQIKQLSVVFN